MSTIKYQNSILQTIGCTPIVKLNHMSPNPDVDIYVKLEGQNPTGSVKDRIALKMITQAETHGEISPSRTILEPTSGNTGISIALVGKLKGYKVTVVMPDNVSEERTQLLEAYGASIIYSEGEKGSNGSIELAQDIISKNSDDYYMPYQYGNSANPGAHYEGTGPEILHSLPDVDMFIAGLGTGGTLTGTGKYLKEQNPNIKVIAASTSKQAIFSPPRMTISFFRSLI